MTWRWNVRDTTTVLLFGSGKPWVPPAACRPWIMFNSKESFRRLRFLCSDVRMCSSGELCPPHDTKFEGHNLVPGGSDISTLRRPVLRFRFHAVGVWENWSFAIHVDWLRPVAWIFKRVQRVGRSCTLAERECRSGIPLSISLLLLNFVRQYSGEPHFPTWF